MAVTLFIADDHPFIRQGIRSLFESEPGFTVLGEADDGTAALDMIRQLQPDVAILDILMPGLTGLEVAKMIKEQNLKTSVIIVSTFTDDYYVREALKAGALGYVTKETSPSYLLEAVNQVSIGRHYLCPSLTERAVQHYVRTAEEQQGDEYEELTSREREVFFLAAQGLTNSEIADKLVISYRTVEVHRANMMRKLGLNNQMDLLRYAVRRGIIQL